MQVKYDTEKFKSKAEWRRFNAMLENVDSSMAKRIADRRGYEIEADGSTPPPGLPVAKGAAAMTDAEKREIADKFVEMFISDGVYVDILCGKRKNPLVDYYYKSKEMARISKFCSKDVEKVAEWNLVPDKGEPTRHAIYRFSPDILSFDYGRRFGAYDPMCPSYVMERTAASDYLLIGCKKYNWAEAFSVNPELKRLTMATPSLVGTVVGMWTGMSMTGCRQTAYALFDSVDDVLETYKEILKDRGRIEGLKYCGKAERTSKKKKITRRGSK